MTGYGTPKIIVYSCRYNKQTIPALYPYASLPRNSLSANSFARPRYARKLIRLFQLYLLFSATSSFQQFSIVVAAFQYAHLMNGYLAQLDKPLALSHALLDENRILNDNFSHVSDMAYMLMHKVIHFR